MADPVLIELTSLDAPLSPDLVLLTDADLSLSPSSAAALGEAGQAAFLRAAGLDGFKGKPKKVLSVVLPPEAKAERALFVGTSREPAADWAALGGAVAAALSAKRAASIVLDGAGIDAAAMAAFAMGVRLRTYRFDAYKTKKDDADIAAAESTRQIMLHVADPDAVKAALAAGEAVAGGVCLARDLVNEPPNVLFPEAFAERARQLSALGIEVEVLDQAALERIGMRALLGVAQGSAKAPCVVVMRWNGGGADEKPVAFVGKGVTFDSGGISIKPAAGMEDMKGDMAGAACVVGLMHALASRKARVNAIGAIGLVENMPDGNAQRPGDIVTSLSGQTIEMINTDAEGRLVLADVLWYVQDRFKPAYMVNLATLTGAILVALGKEHAGLFSNDDTLSMKLAEAGTKTGEKVWRMPLTPAYDKMIDSRFADMKNTGGRFAGSITAAQFLQRYVSGTPWAHLDIAGTGMAAENSDINRSWGPGWGVRLLNELVARDEA